MFNWKQNMMRIIHQLMAATFILVMTNISGVLAQEPQMSDEVQAWFVALTKVNHPGFQELIADDTKIELRDLGIVQNRDEFIKSLPEWDDATRGAILLTQVISSEKNTDVLFVCYRFKNNEQLNRETYQYADGKITSVIQELIGTECKGF